MKKIMKFSVVYKKTESWYVGWLAEIPNVCSQGRTLKELKENLEDAYHLMVETQRLFTARQVRREGFRVDQLTVA